MADFVRVDASKDKKLTADQARAAAELAGLGATDAVFFHNFRPAPAHSFSAHTGLVASFPPDAPFVRDFCLDVSVGFGTSIVRVRSAAPLPRTFPAAMRARAARRTVKLVPERSAKPPKCDDDPDGDWAPSLGRGGRIGLYLQRASLADDEWFVVVSAGVDEATLENFERALETVQNAARSFDARDSPTTFGDVVPMFDKMEKLAERNRAKLVALFVQALELEVLPPKHLMPFVTGSTHEGETDDDEGDPQALEWLQSDEDDDLNPSWFWRAPSRDVACCAPVPESARAKPAPAPRTCENKFASVDFSVSWNVLRKENDKVVWFSDCAPMSFGKQALYVDPAMDVVVYRWAGTHGDDDAPLAIHAPSGSAAARHALAFPCVVVGELGTHTPRQAAECLVWSDKELPVNTQACARYVAQKSVAAECKVFGGDFLQPSRTMEPVVVALANRDVVGRVGGPLLELGYFPP